MNPNAKWAPMLWRCGPLEAARLSASNDKKSSAENGSLKTADQWADPAMLQLLDGATINCLVVDWAAGGEVDAAQQKALRPLIEAGGKKGLGFVGRVTANEGVPALVTAAKAAGLDAVMLSGPDPGGLALPVIASFSRDDVDWDKVTDTFALSGNVWPGAEVRAWNDDQQAQAEPGQKSDQAMAGPTRDPWVDSNGWVPLLARGVAPGKTLWLEIPLPEAKGMLPAEKYCLAVADCRAHGCRWMIDLDAVMREAMAHRDPKAMEAWKKICAMDAFFDGFAQPGAVQPIGMLTVVSDFRRSNAMNGEVLNLLKRQHVPFTVVDRTRPMAAAIAKARAILWLDETAPTREQHQHLMALVEQGGVVIAASYWGPKGVTSHREDWLFGYDIYPIGKGRIVAATMGFPDAFQVGRDAHLIVGREHDPIRLFNPGTTSCFAAVDPATGKEIVQILNYNAPTEVEYLTLWVHGSVSAARLVDMDASHELKSTAEFDGTSFGIPPVVVHYAVEIERKG